MMLARRQDLGAAWSRHRTCYRPVLMRTNRSGALTVIDLETLARAAGGIDWNRVAHNRYAKTYGDNGALLGTMPGAVLGGTLGGTVGGPLGLVAGSAAGMAAGYGGGKRVGWAAGALHDIADQLRGR